MHRVYLGGKLNGSVERLRKFCRKLLMQSALCGDKLHLRRVIMHIAYPLFKCSAAVAPEFADRIQSGEVVVPSRDKRVCGHRDSHRFEQQLEPVPVKGDPIRNSVHSDLLLIGVIALLSSYKSAVGFQLPAVAKKAWQDAPPGLETNLQRRFLSRTCVRAEAATLLAALLDLGLRRIAEALEATDFDVCSFFAMGFDFSPNVATYMKKRGRLVTAMPPLLANYCSQAEAHLSWRVAGSYRKALGRLREYPLSCAIVHN